MRYGVLRTFILNVQSKPRRKTEQKLHLAVIAQRSDG